MVAAATTIDWYQIVTVLVSSSAIAAGITLLYNWRSQAKEIRLQKRTKRADWLMQSSGRYYRLAIIVAELDQRLGDSSINYEVCFFYLIQYLKAYKRVFDAEASYFFDDIQGEFFLRFLEDKINLILRNDKLLGQTNWRVAREIITDQEGIADMINKLQKGDIASDIFQKFKKFVEDADNLKAIRSHLLVYHAILLFEINKLLIPMYENEKLAKQSLRNYFESPTMAALPSSLEKFNTEFKERYKMEFRMYNKKNKLIV